jgi:carboxypeptidase Q
LFKALSFLVIAPFSYLYHFNLAVNVRKNYHYYRLLNVKTMNHSKLFSTLVSLLLILWLPTNLISQDEDAAMIQKIHENILSQGTCYQTLTSLCTDYPGRIAGSTNYQGAANYTLKVLSGLPKVKATFQDCQANYWVRGDIEDVAILNANNELEPMRALSLGNSVSTNNAGIMAEVIEVQSLDEVEKLGDAVSGKIVFFNRPMDPTKVRTFNAYGGAVDQRVYGASRVAKYGGAAALVRSMTTRLDDYPHTGVTIYEDSLMKVPGVAISTNDANKLSDALKKGSVKVYINTNCRSEGLRSAPTVIGEIKGSEFPDEIIVVGGHLDSWDVGQGAHDDGAGCVQAMEVLQAFNRLNYKPKRTIRCVLFSNEENGLAGGKTYAAVSNKKKETHIAALESDSGGFSPRGFSFEADTSVFKAYYKSVSKWLPLLESYGLQFEMGGSGADISPLKSQKGLLIGLRPDSQRYFDFHHTEIDTIDNVNQRELELGASAMASLIYLIDKYGLK